LILKQNLLHTNQVPHNITPAQKNQAIRFVFGWDGNHSRYNFLTVPEGGGAWISKTAGEVTGCKET
jgi:C1A family cysteine protease